MFVDIPMGSAATISAGVTRSVMSPVMQYAGSFEEAVLANTNAGGENCHRGSALGALMGAAVGEKVRVTNVSVTSSPVTPEPGGRNTRFASRRYVFHRADWQMGCASGWNLAAAVGLMILLDESAAASDLLLPRLCQFVSYRAHVLFQGIPDRFIQGLNAYGELRKEIDEFVASLVHQHKQEL